MLKITPFLWFDDQAEAAARFYVSVFPNSRIVAATPNKGAPGPSKTLTVQFELDGLPVTALNGGPMYQFNEAVSFWVSCDDQAEVDRYWTALLAGGGEEIACGWLKDRFGLCWQVVPKVLPELIADPDAERAGRVLAVMMQMKKLIIADLVAAAG
ncbi:MAG: VOC family protein [Caulobacteraceae bacterium]|nr:VOC family protein [Caulobacteraceae bacterium]